MKTIYRESLGKCDICGKQDLDVLYDMPFRGSSWANVCEQCRPQADNPNNPIGTKIVKGTHPNADPPEEKAAPMTMGAALEAKEKRRKEKQYVESLTQDQIEEMMFDGAVECADGCSVEPDGKCPHGYSSPLILLGLL